MSRWQRVVSGGAALTMTSLSVAAQSTVHGRPMTPSDLLSIRSYGAMSPSPDGRLIAVEVMRSRNDGDRNNTAIDFVSRSDLWLVWRTSGRRRRLLPDNSKAVRSWNPEWSPTGRYLAFLSTNRPRNAYLNVWDRQTGHIRQVLDSPIDLAAEISQASSGNGGPICWIDSTKVALVGLPSGRQSLSFSEDRQSLAIRMQGLETADRGRVATAIVASSPPDSTQGRTPLRATLFVADVPTGVIRGIGDIPLVETRLAHRLVVVSRTGRYAAIVVHLSPSSPDPNRGWDLQTAYPARLGVVSFGDRPPSVHWLDTPAPFTGRDFTDDLLLSWAPDDSAFSVITVRANTTTQVPDTGTALAITVVDPRTATARSHAPLTGRHFGSGDAWGPTALGWTKDGRSLIRWRSSAAMWIVDGDTVQRARDAEIRGSTLDHAAQHESFSVEGDGRLVDHDSSATQRTLFPPLNPRIGLIDAPHYIEVNYNDKRGDTLQATALLPFNYVPGRRYPTVVYVYGGTRLDGIDRFAERDDDSFLNMLLLSAHGYVVLEPSVPLDDPGPSSDPMLHLDEGVGPAVDRLIAMGIADSTELALIGHSYGGYTVLGLLTQTHRYKAAIALAGLSDLISLDGVFDPRHRYTEPNAATTMGPLTVEGMQGRMGAPPWRDPQRYIRNSPLFSIDKVDTPLLIIQGDLDLLNTQSEELYTALLRLGRRAELVTYLGEAHSIESPADIIDMWGRMFRWLDSYVMPLER